jgi:hypothetical protein
MAAILIICIHGGLGFFDRDRLNELIELLSPVGSLASENQAE